MLCPRRGENPGPWALPEQDEVRPDGTCSYCGSITPEAFFAAVEAGSELEPTDKSYKVYIDVPETKTGPRVISASSGDEMPSSMTGWVRVDDAMRKLMREQGWGGNYTWAITQPFGPTRRAKFYFQHLDDPGRRRFVEMLNARQLRVAYPGYFYVLPFFVAPAERPA